jgi:hypothetical protein
VNQTINYANNEGVRWCVLTNGVQYRIYRTVEPVPMERKMLVEVNLLDQDREPRELARSLGALAQQFVCAVWRSGVSPCSPTSRFGRLCRPSTMSHHLHS